MKDRTAHTIRRNSNIKPPLNPLWGKVWRVTLAKEGFDPFTATDQMLGLISLRNLVSKWWFEFRRWNYRNVTAGNQLDMGE